MAVDNPHPQKGPLPSSNLPDSSISSSSSSSTPTVPPPPQYAHHPQYQQQQQHYPNPQQFSFVHQHPGNDAQYQFVPQQQQHPPQQEKQHLRSPSMDLQQQRHQPTHQKSLSMPHPQIQGPPSEDLVQSLFGPTASSMSISEETIRAAIQLKTEQERTKQEYYRLEHQRKNAEILQNAINNNIPQNMIPILFQNDQDHSSSQMHPYNQPFTYPPIDPSNQQNPPPNNSSVPASDRDRLSYNHHQRNLSLPSQPTIIPSEYQQRVTGTQQFQPSSTTQQSQFRHHAHHASLSSIPPAHYSPTRGPAIGQQTVFHSNPLYNMPPSSSSTTTTTTNTTSTRPGINQQGNTPLATVPGASSWQQGAANPNPYFPPPQNPYPANPGSPSTSVHQIIQFHHWTPSQQKSTSSSASASSPKKDDSDSVSIKRRRSITVSERHSDRIGSPTPSTKGSTASSSANTQPSAIASANAHSKRRSMHSRNKSETSVLRGDTLSKMSLYSTPNTSNNNSSSSLTSLATSSTLAAKNPLQNQPPYQQGGQLQSTSDASGPATQPIHLGPHTPSLPPPSQQPLQHHPSSSLSSPLRNDITNQSPPESTLSSASQKSGSAVAIADNGNRNELKSLSHGSAANPATHKVSTLTAVMNDDSSANFDNAEPLKQQQAQNAAASFNFLASVAADSQRLASPAKISGSQRFAGSAGNASSPAVRPLSSPFKAPVTATAAAGSASLGSRSTTASTSPVLEHTAGHAARPSNPSTPTSSGRSGKETAGGLNTQFSYPPKPPTWTPASGATSDTIMTTIPETSPKTESPVSKSEDDEEDVSMEYDSFESSAQPRTRQLDKTSEYNLSSQADELATASDTHNSNVSVTRKKESISSEEQRSKKQGVGFIISGNE